MVVNNTENEDIENVDIILEQLCQRSDGRGNFNYSSCDVCNETGLGDEAVPHSLQEQDADEVGHFLLRLRAAAPSGLSHEVRRQPETRSTPHPVCAGLSGVCCGGEGTGGVAPEL